MGILLNQKFKITVFIATLLAVGCIHKQPISQQQSIENLSLSQINNSPIPRLSHNLFTQKPSTKDVKTNEKSVFYSVIDEWQKYQYSINANQVLRTGKLPNSQINFNQSDLLTVLTNTRKYFQKYSQEDRDIQRT